MKISEQPTSHILVKAHCHSEWDNCNFAIINCGDGWAEDVAKRMDSTRHLDTDTDFFSAKYFDCGVSFYVSKEELDELLPAGKDWAFVELEEDEESDFTEPETMLDCYEMVLFKEGKGRYQAIGEYTGEEFHTEDLPLREIIKRMR
jgi:hypothetical protein